MLLRSSAAFSVSDSGPVVYTSFILILKLTFSRCLFLRIVLCLLQTDLIKYSLVGVWKSLAVVVFQVWQIKQSKMALEHTIKQSYLLTSRYLLTYLLTYAWNHCNISKLYSFMVTKTKLTNKQTEMVHYNSEPFQSVCHQLFSMFIPFVDITCAGANITMSDLSNYHVRVYPALSMSLHSGHVVHTLRPPSSGVLLAFMLRVLEGQLLVLLGSRCKKNIFFIYFFYFVSHFYFTIFFKKKF